jgi:DNA polymerase-3 subunit beta
MLIPIKTCNILTKLIKSKNISSEKEDSDSTEGDFPIFIYFSNETVKIAFRNITIYSRLIDETFPNYESVIPTDNEKILKVNRKQLIDSLKRSIVMSDQITNRTTFKINENQVKVFAANTEVGTDAEESIECTFTESDEFEISFNGKYLLEAVEQIDSEDILFDFNTPHKASILRPSEQQENENLIILVMPVRSL